MLLDWPNKFLFSVAPNKLPVVVLVLGAANGLKVDCVVPNIPPVGFWGPFLLAM